MDKSRKTKLRNALFEGAHAYSQLEDRLVEMADYAMERDDLPRLREALEWLIDAHQEVSRGLYALAVDLADAAYKSRGELVQSLGEIAWEAWRTAHEEPPILDFGQLDSDHQARWEAVARVLFTLGVGGRRREGSPPDVSPTATLVEDPRPTYVTTAVSEPVLLFSLQHAKDVLGEEAIAVRSAFLHGEALTGLWLIPHPDVTGCTCGRDAGTHAYSAHEGNPDGHATSCPKWGASKARS